MTQANASALPRTTGGLEGVAETMIKAKNSSP
jgi:hypothetical protein